MVVKCCAGNCTSTSETHEMYRLPKNDSLRALWLSFIVPTKPDLLALTKDQLIHRKLCSKHFDKEQFGKGGRRLRLAYPCLFSKSEIALREPRNALEWNILNEHNYFKKKSRIRSLQHVMNIDNTAGGNIQPMQLVQTPEGETFKYHQPVATNAQPTIDQNQIIHKPTTDRLLEQPDNRRLPISSIQAGGNIQPMQLVQTPDGETFIYQPVATNAQPTIDQNQIIYKPTTDRLLEQPDNRRLSISSIQARGNIQPMQLVQTPEGETFKYHQPVATNAQPTIDQNQIIHKPTTDRLLEQPDNRRLSISSIQAGGNIQPMQLVQTPEGETFKYHQPVATNAQPTIDQNQIIYKPTTGGNIQPMQLVQTPDGETFIYQPVATNAQPTIDQNQIIHKPTTILKRKPSKKRRLMKQLVTISSENLGNSIEQTLQKSQLILQNPLIKNFYGLPKNVRNFMEMQLKHVSKKKMARTYTLDEKLMALSIMKQSPKGYKLLEKIFTLPNKKTLSRLSQNIDFEPGLNPHIFEHLKKNVNNWDEKKKLCSILYDEVALTPHVTFDENKDEIIGFVDVNGKKKMAYCDHALVFMVRGVCASWRQCIAYHFVQGTVSASELKVILKDIVVQVAQTGLIPIALVSDQGSTFRTTIRNLRLDSIRSRTLKGLRDDGTVDVAGHMLNVFFDPPHLLKSVRNNFVNKDVLWADKTASWQDIQYIYDIDNKLGHTRFHPALTACHVDPNKMRKMKVSIAAQVLSARTAAMLKFADAIRADPQSTMKATIEFVEFMDNLFDSVNGYPGGNKKGKLRSAVKCNSAHEKFWSSAIKQLKIMKFIDRNSKVAVRSGQPRYIRVPCLEGWITSLESFKRISKLLFEKYHADFYYPRYINQDPLENFFGRLRALNYRNVNPNAITFKYSFKSLTLSNVLSPHSRSSNCEEDEGETIMNIRHLFSKKHNVNTENVMIDDKENVSPNPNYANIVTSCSQNRSRDALMSQVINEKMRVHCSAYTAGYICQKITKTTNCKQCMKTYLTQNIENIHMYIQYREYKTLKSNSLAYPNENFIRLYRDAAQLIHSYLNVFCHRKRDLGLKLKNLLLGKLPLSVIGCNKHQGEVQNLFLKIIIRLQVHNWCKIINKILKGAVEDKYVLKMNEPQKMALNKYNAFKLRKKCLLK